MIELFSRPQSNIKVDDGKHLIPLIPEDDDLSSLSAILLNDDYYKLLLNGSIKINDISILDKEYLILFKIRAWIDLTNKKSNGEFVRTKEINKHKHLSCKEKSCYSKTFCFAQIFSDCQYS